MFGPLMASPPSTPKREGSNASPGGSDKDNDAPRDPLSLTQYFNWTCHVKSLKQPFNPKGELVGFGDASIDKDNEFISPGPLATEDLLDSRDALLPTPLPMNPHGECDVENPPPLPSNEPFITACCNHRNRPRTKGHRRYPSLQLRIVDPLPGAEPVRITPGPVVTLYPPAPDPLPPTSSAPRISDRVGGYLSPKLPLLHCNCIYPLPESSFIRAPFQPCLHGPPIFILAPASEWGTQVQPGQRQGFFLGQ